MRPVQGVLAGVLPRVRQLFERFRTPSAASDADARFAHFRRSVWPRMQEAGTSGACLPNCIIVSHVGVPCFSRGLRHACALLNLLTANARYQLVLKHSLCMRLLCALPQARRLCKRGERELHVQGSWCSSHLTLTTCACELWPRPPAPTLRRCQSMLRCVCWHMEGGSNLPHLSHLSHSSAVMRAVSMMPWHAKSVALSKQGPKYDMLHVRAAAGGRPRAVNVCGRAAAAGADD